MHEWPLVVFTTLTIAASGAFAWFPIGEVFGVACPPPARVADAATLAVFTALVAALGHLGQPRRAPLAFRRAGRNVLSTEVLLAALVLALGVARHLTGVTPGVRAALAWLAGIAATLLLVAVGLVYFLPGRRPWRSALVATPLVLGLAAGLTTRLAAAPTRDGALLASVLLLVDAAVAVPVWTRHASPARRGMPLYPSMHERLRTLIGLRFALVNVATPLSLWTGLPGVAVAVLLAGIFVDRVTFYGTVCAETTEAEIARVEDLIAGRSLVSSAPGPTRTP
jgi:DMSO reductase anchor subunit